MFDGRFYKDAENLSEMLDKLAESHNNLFVGTSRYDPITLLDNLDALECAFRHGQRVILSFSQGFIEMGDAMKELVEAMDQSNLGALHSSDTESYSGFRGFLRRIDHKLHDLAWRLFFWVLRRIS